MYKTLENNNITVIKRQGQQAETETTAFNQQLDESGKSESRVLPHQLRNYGVAAVEYQEEVSWAAVGGSGQLMCQVRAAPPPTFVWSSQSGLILLNSDKFKIHEPELLDGLLLWASTLEVRNVAPEDYTSYRCTAHNSLGAHTVLLTLKPPARPHPPTNFSVSKVTGGEVWLTWSPSLDGGAPSGYTLKYKSANAIEYKYVEVSGGGARSARVSGLSAATEYTAAIQASNDHGRSHFVSLSFFTLLGKSDGPTSLQGLAVATSGLPGGNDEESPEGGGDEGNTSQGSSRVPRLILLIMTLTGAALLVLNISIIACFVRRRAVNRQPSMTSSSKSSALGSSGATPVPTPANSNHLLPLSTMSSNNFSNIPTGYQTKLEESEMMTLATSDISISSNTHMMPRHNGGIITTQSTLLVLNNTAPKTTQAAAAGPSQQWTEGESSSSGSVSPDEGGLSQRQHDLVNFTTEPDVCSVGSSFYDNTLQEVHRRRSSDTYPADDQYSLCSSRSNNSRVYAQGYLRPLSSLGGLQQQQATPQLIQDTLHAIPRLSPGQQRLAQQNLPEYSSLNPSGLYSLRTENPDSKHSLISFTAGGAGSSTPPGYSTLGPRQRRTKPTSFSAIQRRTRSVRDTLPASSHYDNLDLASRLQQEGLQYEMGSFSIQGHAHQHENSGSSGYSSSPHQEVRRSLTSNSRLFAGETTDTENTKEVPEASSASIKTCEDSPDSSQASTSRESSNKTPTLSHSVRSDQDPRAGSHTHAHGKNRER
ncbi:serine-rich adhesin for platelets-like [Cherax quadricarinatus]